MSDENHPKDEKDYFFDRPEVIRWIIRGLYIICTVLVVIDIFAVLHIGIERHIENPLEKIPAYYPIYGFVGCVILVLIAREMRKFLMRKESYYDDME